MSSPVALMSGAAVIMAAIAFATTGQDEPEKKLPQQVALASDPAPVERQATVEPVKRPKKPPVRRNAVYVSVFNNSNITGLAASTATRIGAAGWQVVGSDNWYGTIPATTIYYPERLQDAARLLSKDLGVERVMPAVDPMSMDRLTVILTADFA